MSDSGRWCLAWATELLCYMTGETSPLPWCDHGLGSNSRMTAESWLLFLFSLFTFLGWREQAPTLEWSEGWAPSCRFCGPVVPSPGTHVSTSPDPPSQRQIRADWFDHLAVTSSCSVLRMLSRSDRRESILPAWFLTSIPAHTTQEKVKVLFPLEVSVKI